MSRAKKIWRPCLRVGMFLLSALPCAHLSAAGENPASVSDLRYGVSLYHYFQHDYLAAVSELQVAELRGGIAGHDNVPPVLRGEMSLAFGLESSATQMFEQATYQHGSESVRNAAWFYLSKMRFRRGDWQGARDSLLQIEGDIEPSLRDELNAMQVNVALRSGDLATAVSVMDELDRENPWQPYIFYNLGTSYISAGRIAEGIDYLDRLAAMEFSSPEYLAVRDKALTAAGFSLMQQRQYTEALTRFSKVQLNSPVVEQALLGYGWSAVELGDYHRALAPWQRLAGRSPLRPAVQEALLAVPYSYEKLGSVGSALSKFEAAEAVFSAELERLDALKLSLTPRYLLEVVRFTNAEPFTLESEIDPELAGLIELLSGDQFQRYSRDVNDLDSLGQRLDYWRSKLEIYGDMLQHPALGAEQKSARVLAYEERRLQQLQQRVQLQTVALDESRRATDSRFYQLLLTELEQQQHRLRYYQSQARLAQARLYDRAQMEVLR